MAEHIIPVPPNGVYQWVLRREFDKSFFRFRYRWNERVKSWYLDVANGANVRQVYGIRLGTGTDKLRSFKARDIPRGTLNVVDSTGEGVQPTLKNFGKTVLLKYVDEPETTTTIIAREQPVSLPAPTEPEGVALHAEEHEDGGGDPLELDKIPTGVSPPLGSVLTYSGGNTASWQLPTVPAHEAQHRLTGTDSIILETLKTGEADTSKVINPDGSGGLGWDSDISGPFVSFYHTVNVDGIDDATGVIVAWNADRHGGTPDATYFTYPVPTNRVQINRAGKYRIVAKGSFILVNASSDNATLFMEVFVNGSTSGLPVQQAFLSETAANSTSESMELSAPLSLAVDDEVHILFRTGSSLAGTAFVRILADTAEFSITYIGP